MTEPKPAAVVTGAAGGIGAAIADRLRRDGYWVLGLDRVPVGTDCCDVAVEADLAQIGSSQGDPGPIVAEICRHLAERRLRALVHCAALQVVGELDTLSVRAFEQTLATNLLAPFELTRRFADQLRRARGAVVNVGSIHAGLSKPGFALYSTSKAALSGLTRALALELAPLVRVNEIRPAATDTGMLREGFGARWSDEVERSIGELHPLQRIAAPDEIAAAVSFLISEQASFVTGAVLDVSGGIHARLHDVV